jgi:hypothetical protein
MNTPNTLTLVEDAVLLALDDKTGAVRKMPPRAYDYLLAGALLSDLALAGRIDTDPEKLTVVSAEATGDPLLDGPLTRIAAGPAGKPATHWLWVFAEGARDIERAATDRLVNRGILKRSESKILWALGLRRYPTVDNQERVEVLTRLGSLVLGDELPDPKDAILIGLLTGCRLDTIIFTGPTYESRRERIAALSRMDLVGREVGKAVDTIIDSMNRMVPLSM